MQTILKIHSKDRYIERQRTIAISVVDDTHPQEDRTLIRLETTFDNLCSGSQMWCEDRVPTDVLHQIIDHIYKFKTENTELSKNELIQANNFELGFRSSAAMIRVDVKGHYLGLGIEISLSLGTMGGTNNDTHAFTTSILREEREAKIRSVLKINK